MCLLLLFSKPVVSQSFSWVNEFVIKPTSDWDGSTYIIPAIEGEVELIQCQIKAERDKNYILSVLYDRFHANITIHQHHHRGICWS